MELQEHLFDFTLHRGHGKISRLSGHTLQPRHSYKILTKCLSCCVCQTIVRARLSLLFPWANGKKAPHQPFWHEQFLELSGREREKKKLDCLHFHACTHLTINTQFPLTSNNEWLTIYSAKHAKAELRNYPLCWNKYNIHISEQRTSTWKYD